MHVSEGGLSINTHFLQVLLNHLAFCGNWVKPFAGPWATHNGMSSLAETSSLTVL